MSSERLHTKNKLVYHSLPVGLAQAAVSLCCSVPHYHTHTHTHTQLSPENGESYVEYLISIGRLDEAAVKLAEIVNDVSHTE